MISTVCAQCGKEFMCYPSALKRGRLRCSLECGSASLKRTAEQVFDRFVVRSGPDRCWEWSGAKQRFGYGAVNRWKGQRKICDQAHRVSYELYVGPIPPGMQVCHTCDNPPCCNPAHLFLGTHADNARDMIEKGRGRNELKASPGEKNPAAKISDTDVITIRQSKASGVALASVYGVSKTAISRIRLGKTWRHIA